MIAAAGALVLLGLGLFVAGLVTGTTAYYWLCVGSCVLAGLLLALARVRQDRAASAPTTPPAAPSPAAPGAGGPTAAAEVPTPAAHVPRPRPAQPASGDPAVEDVEVTDLLLVVDLRDEVLVVDGHPRYHLAGCRALAGGTAVPLPVDEARTDGFSPCARCAPDRNLAERERGRRAGRTS